MPEHLMGRPDMVKARQGGDISKDSYLAAALENLHTTSRTARGVVDTSASVDKAGKMAEGLTGQDAAEKALDNFSAAVEFCYQNKDREFQDSNELRAFIEQLAQMINQGLLKAGILLREGADSAKYPYTRVAELAQAMEQFYQELLERLQDTQADPQTTAAFVEYRIDLTDHFFADGCGKVAKAVSAWTLMRAKSPLPHYDSRQQYYAHAPRERSGQDQSVDKQQWEQWLNYYKGLF